MILREADLQDSPDMIPDPRSHLEILALGFLLAQAHNPRGGQETTRIGKHRNLIPIP